MGNHASNGGSTISALNIPIVDFAGWTTSTDDRKRSIATQLIEACQLIGFVYIKNHTIPPSRVAEAFAWSKKLFDLSSQEKKLAPHPDGSAVHRGYSWPGLEKVSNLKGDEEDAEFAKQQLRQVADVKESYEIGSEHYPEQPNVWLPEHILPGFRAFTTEFYWECQENAKMILRAMALGIGLSDEDFFLESHSGHHNQLRLLHYPSISASHLEDNSKTRMDAHTDWGSITMVFQDECGGLQIENPHQPGCFIDAAPVKDAIVMNIGDLMQRWTNDTLKSSLHRVNPPPPTLTPFHSESQPSRKIPPRYSIPYFVAPAPDTMVTCLSECIQVGSEGEGGGEDGDGDGNGKGNGEGEGAKYAPIKWRDYMLMRAGMNYE